MKNWTIKRENLSHDRVLFAATRASDGRYIETIVDTSQEDEQYGLARVELRAHIADIEDDRQRVWYHRGRAYTDIQRVDYRWYGIPVGEYMPVPLYCFDPLAENDEL